MRKMAFFSFHRKAVCVGLCLFSLIWGYSQQASTPETRRSDDVVLVNVSVTDRLNRFVTGLHKDDFRIYENKAAQSIAYFAHTEVPLSLSIVLDLTEEEETIRKEASNAVLRFVNLAAPEDEFFLVTFNRNSALVQTVRRERPTQVEKVRSFGLIEGLTQLDQAIYAGLNILTKDREKRGLAIVTASRANYSGALRACRDIDAQPGLQVYAIRAGGSRYYLDTLAKVYLLSDLKELGYYLDLVYAELRNQYVLGYTPSGGKGSGVDRDVSVEVQTPPGLPKLAVKHGKGYYAQRR